MVYVKLLSENCFNYDTICQIYIFIISIDYNELNVYYYNKHIFTFQNDLDVYQITALRVLEHLEEMEKYEECHELQKKINECKIIKLKNQIKNEKPI
jgi:hypothetical protein